MKFRISGRERTLALKFQDLSGDLRLVLEIGKLIRKYRGKFVATKLGRDLIEPGSLGRLFALLFQTKFRVFNLAFHDRLVELPDFQQFLGFSLYRLHGQEPGRWFGLAEAAPGLMHPDLAASLPVRGDSDGFQVDYRRWVVELRLLRPLAEFGLVEFERKRQPGLSRDRRSLTRFRTNRLYHQLVGFDLE